MAFTVNALTMLIMLNVFTYFTSSDPAILFLDEPTSGLDAFQANSVMESMKALAKNGRLVISVIHQPRSSIYEMFDRLLLLSCGRVMFLGKSMQF